MKIRPNLFKLMFLFKEKSAESLAPGLSEGPLFRILAVVPDEKSTSFGEFRRAGATFICAVLISGMAFLFYASGDPLFTWLSVVPGLIALALFLSTIHSLLAAQTPATGLMLANERLRPGQATEVIIRQPGPVRFQSLRATLICERIRREFPNKARTIDYPVQLNFFDSGPCDIREADTKEFRTEVIIPVEAEPSLESAGLIIRWRIELWGKVMRRADFMRPFAFEVI